MSEEIVKVKRGRPMKTLDDLPKDWKEQIIELGEGGKTIDHIKIRLGLSNGLYTDMLARDPEFSAVVKEFKRLTKMWWIDHGQKLSTGESQGNGVVWKFNMANRIGWTDKANVEQTTTHKAEQSAVDLFATILEQTKT